MSATEPAMNTPEEAAVEPAPAHEVTPGPEGETPDTFRNQPCAPAPDPGQEG